MSPRRILIYSTMEGSPWGGSEDLWGGAAAILAGAGHSVFACVKDWPKPHPRMSALAAAGVQIMPRRQRLLGLKVKRHFERAVAQARPDIVLISNGAASPPTAVARACVRAGAPYVSVSHANFEGWAHEDQDAEPLRAFFRGAAAACFVSEHNRRLIERQLAFTLENARIVRNPCATLGRAATPWPTDAHGPQLACVGRLHTPSKGQDVLIEALSRPEWRDRPWSLSFYGEGPQGGLLRDLCALRGLSERVRFAGTVPDIAEVWRDHHALALTSRFEGLPLAIVEAMACGRVVIATDVGGAAEVVSEGETGFLAEAPIPALVSAALERAFAAWPRWRAMGEAARARVEAEFPQDACADFAALLLDAAAGRAP